MQAEEP
jgi:rhamnogalacturonyl hydrolase YesR